MVLAWGTKFAVPTRVKAINMIIDKYISGLIFKKSTQEIFCNKYNSFSNFGKICIFLFSFYLF